MLTKEGREKNHLYDPRGEQLWLVKLSKKNQDSGNALQRWNKMMQTYFFLKKCGDARFFSSFPFSRSN